MIKVTPIKHKFRWVLRFYNKNKKNFHKINDLIQIIYINHMYLLNIIKFSFLKLANLIEVTLIILIKNYIIIIIFFQIFIYIMIYIDIMQNY